jgi:hypothetical protein
MGSIELIPSAFVNNLSKRLKASRKLHIKFSNATIFDSYDADEVIDNPAILDHGSGNTNYDFILGDLPIGLRRIKLEDSSLKRTFKTRQNWAYLYFALKNISNNGLGLFVVEPAFWSSEWHQFLEFISRSGFFFIAAFRFLNQKIHNTSLIPNIAVFSRKKSEPIFVADIHEQSNLDELVDSFLNKRYGNNLEEGIGIDSSEFRGFTQLIIEKEIEALQTQYKTYKRFKLVPDLAPPENVFLCGPGKKFKTSENSIYIPRVGTSNVIPDLNDAKLKHHNYIKVILDSNRVINNYLSIFFSSKLGKLTLQSLQQGSVIGHIPKTSLERIDVPVPDVKQQKIIIDAHRSLINLDTALSDFKEELSLNPMSASAIIDDTNSMLKQVNRLSQSDKVRALIRQGESTVMEFKETLVLDVKKGTKEKYIEVSVLKTVAAFLNSRGGTLFVGVKDSGELLGIKYELEKFFKGASDNFLKHLKNILKRSIGEKFYPLIDYGIIDVDGVLILSFKCDKASEPCFLDGSDFYVRTNPATDKLTGQKMYDYLKQRFN